MLRIVASEPTEEDVLKLDLDALAPETRPASRGTGRLLARWREIGHDVDVYAALWSGDTAVVVLEPP